MRQLARLLAAILAVAAVGTGVAIAASSPTVATGAATGATPTTAVLHATVNPSGNQTDYLFDYGPTTALGLTTASHAVGHGVAPVAVALTIGGLTPGTTYYYRVAALNRSGGSNGALRAFKTTGNPPASVATGPAVDVGKYQATPTGSVNPQAAPNTLWAIQYGLTPAYGLQTFPLALAAVATSLPVSAQLPGLAPGKLFHYRIVASNASGTSVGADQTFFTYPAFRRTPKLPASISPAHLTRKPYTFTASGSVQGAFFVPVSLRCTGQVGVRVDQGKRQVALVVTSVNPDCTFTTPVPLGRVSTARGSAVLQVQISFRGNGYLKPVQRNSQVTVG